MKKPLQLTRRVFLARGSLGLAASSLCSARSWAQVPGANGDLRIAVVGLNGKGKDHVAAFRNLRGVRVVALCDVDAAAFQKVTPDTDKHGPALATYRDYRALLAARDIDAVSLVTPNHQHTLQSIWALQAGKDVFVEKPISHDLWEGQQLVRATEKYGRIVQAGMQNRSSAALLEAIAWQRAGHIGKVTLARGFCYKRRESIGKTRGPQPIPASIDYDLWLAPAMKAPLRRARLHYDWHWQWATGNGDIGNQGNHQLDVARRFLGELGLPPRVRSWGGRVGYQDDGQTPNTLLVHYEYASAPLLFELRGLPARRSNSAIMDEYRGLSVGNIIECEGGYISVPAKDYSSASAFDREGRLLREFKGGASHYQNFVDAVRSRNPAQLNAPIREGHVSSALSHLANISVRAGKPAAVTAILRQVASSTALAEACARLQVHLEANGVDLRRTPLSAGALLSLDPQTETFTGEHAAAAQRFARAEYREPFVVPEFPAAG